MTPAVLLLVNLEAAALLLMLARVTRRDPPWKATAKSTRTHNAVGVEEVQAARDVQRDALPEALHRVCWQRVGRVDAALVPRQVALVPAMERIEQVSTCGSVVHNV
jgi:hypothetical protein